MCACLTSPLNGFVVLLFKFNIIDIGESAAVGNIVGVVVAAVVMCCCSVVVVLLLILLLELLMLLLLDF